MSLSEKKSFTLWLKNSARRTSLLLRLSHYQDWLSSDSSHFHQHSPWFCQDSRWKQKRLIKDESNLQNAKDSDSIKTNWQVCWYIRSKEFVQKKEFAAEHVSRAMSTVIIFAIKLLLHWILAIKLLLHWILHPRVWVRESMIMLNDLHYYMTWLLVTLYTQWSTINDLLSMII